MKLCMLVLDLQIIGQFLGKTKQKIAQRIKWIGKEAYPSYNYTNAVVIEQ